MRVLVVDDEPLALNRLTSLLAGVPDVEIVGEARDGDQALRLARELRPDLLLLDIEMPGPSGMQVAQTLARTVEVVFVTAFADRAADAFALDAVDYLLKPVTPDRLLDAMSRARRRLATAAEEPGPPAPPPPRPEAEPAEPLIREFWVRQHDGHVRVAVGEVQRIEADRDYALLHTRLRTYVMRATMQDLERRLPPSELLRVHRGAFVRPEAVQRVENHRRTALRLHLQDGAIVEVGASYADRVLAALGMSSRRACVDGDAA